MSGTCVAVQSIYSWSMTISNKDHKLNPLEMNSDSVNWKVSTLTIAVSTREFKPGFNSLPVTNLRSSNPRGLSQSGLQSGLGGFTLETNPG